MIFRMLYVFLRRDRLLQLSYRTEYILTLLSIGITVSTFYYVAKVFGDSASASITAYGGSYFPFVMVGIAFSACQRAGLQTMAQKIREEQLQGTLEQALATPISPLLFLAGLAQWELIFTFAEIFLYFAIGILFFGLKLPGANFLAAILIVFLSLLAFAGLGMLSAAFILKFKRGDPAAWLIAAGSELLGGVYFPASVLPLWMRHISRLIPMTHALEGLRLSLLSGASLTGIAPSALRLAAFSLILFPAGVALFDWALRSSLQEGSLGHC